MAMETTYAVGYYIYDEETGVSTAELPGTFFTASSDIDEAERELRLAYGEEWFISQAVNF